MLLPFQSCQSSPNELIPELVKFGFLSNPALIQAVSTQVAGISAAPQTVRLRPSFC